MRKKTKSYDDILESAYNTTKEFENSFVNLVVVVEPLPLPPGSHKAVLKIVLNLFINKNVL